MLQKLRHHITNCLDRSAEAERRAANTADSEFKAEYLGIAKRWMHLAGSYEFVESLERFLLDAQRAKDALLANPPESE